MPKKEDLKKDLNSAVIACPATRMVRIVGGRWKLNILYQLYQNVHRYSDLQRCLPGITPKMLTQQLRELEDDGIIHREVYRQVPPKVEYSIAPLGESLRPVLEAMCGWGLDNVARQVQERTGVGESELKKREH